MKQAMVTIALVLSVAARSQVAPSFEVASVRISRNAAQGGEGSTRESVEMTPTSLSMRNVTLRACIRWAYAVKDFQIAAPSRLTTDRYDILAKTSSPASADRVHLMLRALLAERFKLTLHREVKDLPVYTLRLTDRWPKLQQATSDLPGNMRPSGGALEFHNISMAELAELLPQRPFGLDRPVIDRTGLTGSFNFTMKIAANDAELKGTLERGESEQDTSLFLAPLRDLGLQLRPEKDRIEFLVVDHAERVPADN